MFAGGGVQMARSCQLGHFSRFLLLEQFDHQRSSLAQIVPSEAIDRWGQEGGPLRSRCSMALRMK